MPLVKLNGGAGVALVALAVLAASSHAARADTIFLKCGTMNMVAVDLTKHTVDDKPASITPISIDWENANKDGDVHLHIDRTAGTLTISGTYYTQNGNIPIPSGSPDTCTVSSPPSTKF